METESRAQTTNQTQTDSLSPSPNPVSPVPLNNPTSGPRYGTVIPNRIFVGGIDFKTNENDLRKFFSQYGSVKEVKIVNDRAGVSKGYGFITFETQEDAQKILQEAEKLNYKDKKLNIGPAIRKQQVGIPRSSIMPAAGTMYLTTSTGYPYTYHNGVAYFHTPEVTSVPPSWPSRSISSSPVMVAQPVYQQPAYHYQETGWNEDQHVKEIIQTHKRKEKAYLLNLLKRTMNCVEQGKRIGIDSIGR
ncbi:protein boule-like isoform X7 [Rattus norvegicus]|uniref:protein boule-like isoform X7 n=1 Tax=Rattus norvegicus TaxID=10116 RepID=UPI002FD831A7